jgi:transcription antitermination factor NusG
MQSADGDVMGAKVEDEGGTREEATNSKRFVEVGRVVRFKSGPSSGRIAVITEIINHNRVRVLSSPLPPL